MYTKEELNQKFEDLFIDERVSDYYNEWLEEKNKIERVKLSWFKRNSIYLFILFFSSVVICTPLYLFRDRVEQGVLVGYGGNTFFYTTIWVDGKIVEQWSCPPSQVTDSLKNTWKIKAEALLKNLK
jgi:hypothetical protein